MSQPDKIVQQGRGHVAQLEAAVLACWKRACEHDGIEPSARFVVFSDDNPHAKAYNDVMGKYLEARTAWAAGGYVGLRIKKGRATMATKAERRLLYGDYRPGDERLACSQYEQASVAFHRAVQDVPGLLGADRNRLACLAMELAAAKYRLGRALTLAHANKLLDDDPAAVGILR